MRGSGTAIDHTARDAAAAAVVAAALDATTKANAAQVAAIAAGLGVGQVWSLPARSSGVNYTNTTGKPILIFVVMAISAGAAITVGGVVVANSIASGTTNRSPSSFIVPPGAVYSYTGTVQTWAELS